MRIVGGRWRGRNLAGPKSATIRPTADRLRESLFNVLVHGYGDPVTARRLHAEALEPTKILAGSAKTARSRNHKSPR